MLGRLQQLGLSGRDRAALVEAAPILLDLPLEERAQPLLAALMEQAGLSASEAADCIVRTGRERTAVLTWQAFLQPQWQPC